MWRLSRGRALRSVALGVSAGILIVSPFLLWGGVPLCPHCLFLGEPVRIVYGLPGPEALGRAKRGEIKLGGCMVSAGKPTYHCQRCGHEWGHLIGP